MTKSVTKNMPHSERSKRWTWRLSNLTVAVAFAALAFCFALNTALLFIFGMGAIFALINVFLVPKSDHSSHLDK
jgi:hypothetical protein